jgi:hypothetical protein
MKIRLVGVELLYADGRTGMRKLILALHHFANAPKITRTHTHTHTHNGAF